MDDNPITNPFDEDDRKNSTSSLNTSAMSPMDEGGTSGWTMLWLSLGVAAMCLGVLAAGAFFYFKPDMNAIAAKYFPSPTITPFLEATATPIPTPNLTATAAILQATDTATAYLATAANAESNWRVVLKDTFDSNKNNWYVKPTDDEYAKTIYEIKNGKYTWDSTAYQGVINQISIGDTSLSDFYLSVDIQQVSGPNSADYGVTFREDTNSNFYYFGIDGRGEYGFSLYNKDWSTLINWTSSSLIRPGQANRITVLAEGSHFTFFINDQYLTEMSDDTLKNGTTALAIEEANKDDHAVFEFDNVELTTPK